MKVLIAEQLSAATEEALGGEVEIKYVDGTDRAALLEQVADVDAILVRSATEINDEVFKAANQLKVVARAGVGLDNIDVDAATAAGVMVINAPTSNIVSAAELTIALILSGLRRIAQADKSMKEGKWERSALTGVELYQKTVGIIGFGRIGQLVASRLRPFEVNLVTYDPYVSKVKAAEFGAQALSLDELMAQSDVITIHMPKTAETVGMIGAEQLKLAKENLHIVNAARGGLIDEEALYEALKNKKIASAALDVFSTEPATNSTTAAKLLELDNVTLTPHLGASTFEAQERAGVAVAKSVRLALDGELVPDAVNVAGGAIDKDVRPAIALADKLGQLFTSLRSVALNKLEVIVHGEIASKDVKAIELSALRGVFRKVVSDTVSYVNAPIFAKERGIQVELVTNELSERFRNVIELRGTLANGDTLSVSATLSSKTQAQKLIGINEHELDVPLSSHLLVISYEDRPGMVGQIGGILGGAGCNIAGMQVSRPGDSGSEALVVLNLDDAVSLETSETIKVAVGAKYVRPASLNY